MLNLKTIDLSTAESPEDLHRKFAALLEFPDFYGNNWSAFWDAITGLVEMPSTLILYNHLNFCFRFPEDGDSLLQTIWRYNDLKLESKIEYEELSGLRAGKINSIFRQRPFQFGLRGDVPLWDDLEKYFEGKSMPRDEDQLTGEIHYAMLELTGKSTLEGQDYQVAKYNHGGMSGGRISAAFWETRGIPILIGRFRTLKNWTMKDELHSRMEVLKGDITKITASAIVNAANSSLLGGGGVDGAIHRAGGPAILEDCRKIVARQGGCKTGEAVITTAGKLRANNVIHTVGPVWRGGKNNEAQLLANCYANSLNLAVKNDCSTVAFPCISTGIYGYPHKQAAKVAVETVMNFLMNNDSIDRAMFVCYDSENFGFVSGHLENMVRLRDVEFKLAQRNVKYETEIFDSGSIMLDFWTGERCFSIQISSDGVGLSELTDETAFDSRPDRLFPVYSDFLAELDIILEQS